MTFTSASLLLIAVSKPVHHLSNAATIGLAFAIGLGITALVLGCIWFFASGAFEDTLDRLNKCVKHQQALRKEKICPYCDNKTSNRMPAPWETSRRCTACGQEWTI